MSSSSPLATLFMWSPNHYNGRKYPITKLTIHHAAGRLKASTIGNIFLDPDREASATYGIGYDGEVAQYVDEADAPWTSCSYDNDNRAITIEVSNSAVGGDWPVSDDVLEVLINLCVDCVKRNPGIGTINYTGDTTGNLTMHKWFSATACPGPYLESKFPYIAAEINRRLGTTAPATPDEPTSTVLFRVQTGAFAHREGAVSLQAQLQADGFATYLVKAGNLYKVQVGAFASRDNANAQAAKLQAAGYDTYITTEEGTPADDATLTIGDTVKMERGAPVYGTSTKYYDWVYDATLYVRDIDGDCITVSTQRTGAVTGNVHRKYLTEV